MYISFALYCEGSSDRDYLGVLIPRVLEHVIFAEGTRPVEIASQPIDLGLRRRTIEEVARAACEASEAFHLFFVHADSGGRALTAQIGSRSVAYCEAMHRFCEWPCERCIVIAPRHETEAWVMLDHDAVAQALGFNGDLAEHGLPLSARQCETLDDPKAALEAVIRRVRGRRRRVTPTDLFPAIAGRQSIPTLLNAPSFKTFADAVRSALASLGCLDRTAMANRS